MTTHELTIRDDGHWSCACGQWGSRILGSLHGDYCKNNGITEDVVRRWHASHANAIVIQIDPAWKEPRP